jgi:hypothetical protein
MRIVYCETFKSFGCFYLGYGYGKRVFFTSLIYTGRFRYSYFRIGVIKRFQSFPIHYSHEICLYSKSQDKILNSVFLVDHEQCATRYIKNAVFRQQ